MQDLLEAKAKTLAKSVVAHIRWYLNAIFKLAVSDGILDVQSRGRAANSNSL